MIFVTFCAWFLFVTTFTGASVSDANQATLTSGDPAYFASAIVFFPYFIAGYLAKRHELVESFLQVSSALNLTHAVPTPLEC